MAVKSKGLGNGPCPEVRHSTKAEDRLVLRYTVLWPLGAQFYK